MMSALLDGRALFCAVCALLAIAAALGILGTLA